MAGSVTGLTGMGGIMEGLRPTTTAAAVAPVSAPAPVSITVSSPVTEVPNAAKMTSDPLVGVIAQYLDNDGDVVSEVPSSLAQSYLKMGLTANGMQDNPATVVTTA